MSADTEEILRTLAAAEMSILTELKQMNAKLDRILTLAHAIERDVGIPKRDNERRR